MNHSATNEIQELESAIKNKQSILNESFRKRSSEIKDLISDIINPSIYEILDIVENDNNLEIKIDYFYNHNENGEKAILKFNKKEKKIKKSDLVINFL